MINDKFRFDVKQEGSANRVFLRGTIDEDTEFDGLKKVGGPLIINFKGVTSINSCGIRNWVNLMNELSGLQVVYEECPPLIVRQMNMVPSFLGHATVSSVFVPYVCDDCDAEKMNIVKADSFKSESIPETLKCVSCDNGEMELDGNPKQYFAFAK